MTRKNKSCYTCQVREENCGEAKRISPMGWTKHVCAMWFPKDDMKLWSLSTQDEIFRGMEKKAPNEEEE